MCPGARQGSTIDASAIGMVMGLGSFDDCDVTDQACEGSTEGKLYRRHDKLLDLGRSKVAHDLVRLDVVRVRSEELLYLLLQLLDRTKFPNESPWKCTDGRSRQQRATLISCIHGVSKRNQILLADTMWLSVDVQRRKSFFRKL
jgi:hypothetical protein